MRRINIQNLRENSNFNKIESIEDVKRSRRKIGFAFGTIIILLIIFIIYQGIYVNKNYWKKPIGEIKNITQGTEFEGQEYEITLNDYTIDKMIISRQITLLQLIDQLNTKGYVNISIENQGDIILVPYNQN